MAPMAMAAPTPARRPAVRLRGPMPRLPSLSTVLKFHRMSLTKNKGAADRSAAPSVDDPKKSYFRLVMAVRSAESLTMPAAPHQFEPVPNGLFPVTVVVPTAALKAPVKTLQSPFDR